MLTLELKRNLKVNFIGDPHFGKKFGDVPLHRRGEREQQQLDVFEEQLNAESDVTIIVGDLFDTFIVSNEVLYRVYHAILRAAQARPMHHFLFLMGNHDVSRDSTLVSSFSILQAMLMHQMNVEFYRTTQHITVGSSDILMCPYSEFKTAAEDVHPFWEDGKTFDLVVGHWDTISFGSDHNVLPAKMLKDMTQLVVTGHEHNKRDVGIDKDGNLTPEETDCSLFVTGSMIPYSHAEDPEGKLYVTKTLAEVEQTLATNPSAFHDKCLRVVLAPHEQVPEGIDCLQFTVKRIEENTQPLEVKMEDTFSFEKLYRDLMQENEVPKELEDHYWNKMQQVKTDAY